MNLNSCVNYAHFCKSGHNCICMYICTYLYMLGIVILCLLSLGITSNHHSNNDSAVNLSASGNVDQLDSGFVDSFNVHFLINDEASDYKANKCSISSHYLAKSRRYSAAKQCLYIRLHNYVHS